MAEKAQRTIMTNGGYADGTKTSRNARQTPFALREWFVWRRLRWHAALLASAVLFLGYLGPFGTYLQMPLGQRMGFWLAAMAGNWLFALACILPAIAWLSGRIPIIACILVGSLAASLPGTLLISALGFLLSGALPEMLGTGELFLAVAFVHLVIGMIVWGAIELPLQFSGRPPFAASPSDVQNRDVAAASGTPLLDRLPANKRGRLLHLQMRDHYLEIHTDRGSDLVLMRFGDALKELGETEGMQVHRSHWIARAALQKVSRRASRTVALLKDGTEVPVSRRFAKALREADWA